MYEKISIYGVGFNNVTLDEAAEFCEALLSEDHKKMLGFYLGFWREHKDTLINGKLIASNPESAYSSVCAEKDKKAIFTSYTDIIIDCSAYNDIIAVNCSSLKTLIIKGMKGKSYRVVNCMGEAVSKGVIDGYLFEIEVPMAGMIFVK